MRSRPHVNQRRPRPRRRAAQPGALGRLAARVTAGSSATASWTPGKPPPAPPPLPPHRRRGVGKRTHRARVADKRSPGRRLSPSPRLQSCGLGPAGSQPPHASLRGTGQVAGMWGGGSGQLPSSHLGASEWGPGGSGDGSWAPLNPATPPSLPSWGRRSGHPSQHRGLAPPFSLEPAGAPCLTSASDSNWGIWIPR